MDRVPETSEDGVEDEADDGDAEASADTADNQVDLKVALPTDRELRFRKPWLMGFLTVTVTVTLCHVHLYLVNRDHAHCYNTRHSSSLKSSNV